MLINLRNALMAGKRLPYDAEVEYLESTGTQWIDTGITFDGNSKLEMDFKFTSFPNYANCHGQTAANAGDLSPRFSFGKGAASWGDWYCGIGDTNFRTGRTLDTMRHTFTVDAPQKTFAIDETPYTVNWSSFVLPTNPYHASLFCRTYVDNEAQDPYKISGQLYSCKIWQNGVLVRDMIPVRKGTVGYMYDRVSGKLFGNAGTGDFVLGPDVVPVEYIESHGTEWIDTGYVYNADSEFVCDAMLMSVPSDTSATMFGAVQDYNGVFIALNNTVPIQARFGANTVGNIVSNLSVQNAVGVRHKYELSARRLAIDNDVFTRSDFTPYTVNRSIWLCSCNDSVSENLNKRPCSLRAYSFDINNGNTVVHKHIPVRVGSGSTWEGAMMDVLSRHIYRNAGTGAFTYGNDLKYPIPSE